MAPHRAGLGGTTYKQGMLPSPPSSRPTAGKRMRWGLWVFAVVWGAAAAVAYAVYTGVLDIPERFNPWAPLTVAAPPNALTAFKLMRARSDPQRCLAALAGTGMAYDPVPDRETGAGCGFENAVRLRSANIRFGPPLTLSCPMALSFAMWERHALQPAAQQVLGQQVVAIDHLGSYACRNINRGEGVAPGKAVTTNGTRSRHATANALDIAGFTLADGKRINIRRDWDLEETRPPEDMTREARLLREIHGGSCTWFTGVLGPDYNAVHRDHFHLETGGYRMCR